MTSTTRIIVLGTGTAVGKTWVAATLARALSRQGAPVVALKPIESGVDPRSTSNDSDARTLARASTVSPAAPPLAFPDPVSPHLAARRLGVAIELPAVLEYVVRCERDLTTSMTSHVTSFSIVETAGGCFSPLAPNLANRDLAVALDPAVWLLVAADALGVLNDVSATLAALGASGRRPDHVVLSAARAPDASTGTNAAELSELGIVTPAAVAARGDDRALDLLAKALILQAKASLRR